MKHLIQAAAVVGLSVGGAMTTAHADTPQFDEPYFVNPLFVQGVPEFGKMLVGQFNSDLDPDLVVCRPGKRPLMYVNPDRFSAQLRYPVGTETEDIAMLSHDAGPTELLTAGVGGLIATSRKSGQNMFVMRQLGTVPLWNDVTILESARACEGIGWEVFGYKSGTQEIVVLQDVDGVSQTEYTFWLPRPALEICPFVRDESGEIQLAVRNILGVVIYAYDDVAKNWYLDTYLPGPEGGSICALSTENVLSQRLAWLHPGGSGDQLTIINNDDGVLSYSSPIDLGALDGYKIVAAGLTEEAGEDLIVAHTSASSVRVFHNTGGTFDAADFIDVSFSGDPATGNAVVPVACDFDSDGDAEIAYAAIGDQRVFIAPNADTLAVDQMPVRTQIRYGWGGGAPSYLRQHFADSEDYPDGATHVEVIMWRQPDQNSAPDPIGSRHFIAVTSLPADLYIDFDESTEHFDAIYLYSVRYIGLPDGASNQAPPLQVFPASLHAFTTDDGDDWDVPGTTINFLTNHPYYLGATDVVIEHDGALPEDTTTDTDAKPLPDFDDDDEPDGGIGGGG